jgi:sugar phosphate isomerase/epimerase
VAATDRVGIEFLSVFGLPPVEFVELVADLGCRHLSTGLTSAPGGPLDHPPFSLRDDPALRREFIAAMRDHDVSISLGEGMIVRDGTDIRDSAADLDVMSELGIGCINTVSLDPDLGRSFDQFGELAAMARARGMVMTIELSPGLTVGDLPTALAAIEHVGWSNFRLLIDTMHFVRSGSVPADLEALDPDLIGYCQLSDAPLVGTSPSYTEEAMFERRVPGEGELPLRDLLATLPPDVIVGLEIPLRSRAEAGIGPEARLRPCVDAARALLT